MTMVNGTEAQAFLERAATLERGMDALNQQARVLRQEARRLRRAASRLSRGRSVDLSGLEDLEVEEPPVAEQSALIPDVPGLSAQVARYMQEHRMLPHTTGGGPARQSVEIDVPRIVREVAQQLEGRFRPTTSAPSAKAPTIDEIVVMVYARVRKEVLGSDELRKLLEDTVAELDLGDLQERVYQDVDTERVEGALADRLKDQVSQDLDRDALTGVIADKWLETDDTVDTDRVEEALVDKLHAEVSPNLDRAQIAKSVAEAWLENNDVDEEMVADAIAERRSRRSSR